MDFGTLYWCVCCIVLREREREQLPLLHPLLLHTVSHCSSTYEEHRLSISFHPLITVLFIPHAQTNVS